METKNISVQLMAVVLGAAVCLALGTVFLSLGASAYFIGASKALASTGTLLAASVVAFIAVSLMFGLGSFTASRLALRSGLRRPGVTGILTWAAALALISYPINTQLSAFAQVLSQEIMASVVATSEMNLALRNLHNVKPQVTSQVKLKEGQVKTDMTVNEPTKPLTPQLGRIVLEELNSLPREKKLKSDYADAAHDLAGFFSKLSLLLSAALLWSAVASILGGYFGARVREHGRVPDRARQVSKSLTPAPT